MTRVPADEKLRKIGRRDLGLLAEIMFDIELYSVQRAVLRALSEEGATVAEPSCHAAGKSFPAAAVALAFWWTYADEGCKVITISSHWQQMQKVLWGDIRSLARRSKIPLGARVLQGDMEVQDITDRPNAPSHYIVGMSPQRQENVQGHHAPHVLVIGDEATTIEAKIAEGIRSLRSSGDARLLLIFNPTETRTWAYEECKKPTTRVFPVAAWDTPHFSHMTYEEIREKYGTKRGEGGDEKGQEYWARRRVRREKVPKGASLIGDFYLTDLIASGKGPGHPTWENKVEARFVEGSENQMIYEAWLERAREEVEVRPGVRLMGVDLASRRAENVIVYREGNAGTGLEPYPAMNPKVFWEIVGQRADDWKPQWVVYDAGGLGGGVWESAEKAVGANRLIPVRGEQDLPGGLYANLRSAYWWEVAQALRDGRIALRIQDDELDKQLCSASYDVRKGVVRVTPKGQMTQKDLDRADAFVLAFGFDPPIVSARKVADDELEDAELAEEEEWDEWEPDLHAVLDTDDW